MNKAYQTIIELNNINGVSNEYNFSNLIYTDVDGKFIVKTDTNNRDLGIQIDGGQVGIGIKTPEALFHVKNRDDSKISKMNPWMNDFCKTGFRWTVQLPVPEQ